MNTYRIWISGQKDRTLVTRQFETSFAARQWIATRYDLKTYDAVAQRVWDQDPLDDFNYVGSRHHY
jgi:hypothetical protein